MDLAFPFSFLLTLFAQAYGFTERSARRIAEVVRRMEREIGSLKRRGGNTVPMPRWSIVVVLNANLSPGGTAAADVLYWDGADWNDTGEDVTVIDYRDVGNDVQSGTRRVCILIGEYWVVQSPTEYTVQGTAAANISKGSSGNVTLTLSRGTVQATARLGAVDNGDKVQLSWDDDEEKWFISDAECGS